MNLKPASCTPRGRNEVLLVEEVDEVLLVTLVELVEVACHL